MDVFLVVSEGRNAGLRIKVPGPKFFIGRADDCHLRPNSSLISRHHCVILVDDNFVSVRDFGSRNGTLLNDQLIRREEDLESGDILQVGPLVFEVHIAFPIEEPDELSSNHDSQDEGPDISDWIDDADEVVEANRETTVVDGEQTREVTPAKKPLKDRTYHQPESEKPKEEPKEEPVETKTHMLHSPKKPKPADTQTAASDTLRDFFRRR